MHYFVILKHAFQMYQVTSSRKKGDFDDENTIGCQDPLVRGQIETPYYKNFKSWNKSLRHWLWAI